MGLADERRILTRLRLAGIGKLRVGVRELAVVQLGRERERAAGVLGILTR